MQSIGPQDLYAGQKTPKDVQGPGGQGKIREPKKRVAVFQAAFLLNPTPPCLLGFHQALKLLAFPESQPNRGFPLTRNAAGFVMIFP